MPIKNQLQEPERCCLVTKESLEQDEMLRFALSPEGMVTPDIEHKLGGRGCWLKLGREILKTAITKKLFNKGFKGEAKVLSQEDLVNQVEKLLQAKLTNQLGIAKKAGALIGGFDKVKECLQKNKAVLYLGATDTSNNSKEKIDKYIKDLETIMDSLSAEELGEALGRERTAHVVITNFKFAATIKRYAKILKQFKEN